MFVKRLFFAVLLALTVSVSLFPLTNSVLPKNVSPTTRGVPDFSRTFTPLTPQQTPQVMASVPDVYVYPEILGTTDAMSLMFLLHDVFPIADIWVNDDSLSLTSVEQARNYTLGDKKLPFTKGHDCDNFAYQLLGYWSRMNASFVFGFARSQTHAFNFMVDVNLDVYIVESMTNEFILYSSVEEVWGSYYPVTMCMV
jgi:hypothetical protein